MRKRETKLTAKFGKKDDQVSISDITSYSGQMPKKRGRKREKNETYFQKADTKIAEIKEQLKTAKADGMDVKERQRLRNQVSAQQSRIKKKEEVIHLHTIIEKHDQKLKSLCTILTNRLCGNPDILQEILGDIQAKFPKDNANPSYPPPLGKKAGRGKSSEPSMLFKQAFMNTFVTKESDLAKFQHNDVKQEEY